MGNTWQYIQGTLDDKLNLFCDLHCIFSSNYVFDLIMAQKRGPKHVVNLNEIKIQTLRVAF